MYQVGYGPSFDLSATGSTGLRGGPLHWSATRARGRDVEVVEVRWDKTSKPSGKHTKNDGKSPFFLGKSTISMAVNIQKTVEISTIL